MRTIVFIAAMMATVNVFSQEVEYGYDAAGNRIQRIQTLTAQKMDNPVEEEAISSEPTDFEVAIFPNPTHGYMEINIEDTELESATFLVLLFDNAGRKLMQKTENTKKFKLDISGKATGIYYLKIVSGEKVSNWRIVKE